MFLNKGFKRSFTTGEVSLFFLSMIIFGGFFSYISISLNQSTLFQSSASLKPHTITRQEALNTTNDSYNDLLRVGELRADIMKWY